MGQREKRNNNREKGKIAYTLFRTLPVGYMIPIAKRFGVNFQIAYDYKDFRKIATIRYDEESRQNIFYDSNSIRHSISFGVGVTF